jgi:phasin family protein
MAESQSKIDAAAQKAFAEAAEKKTGEAAKPSTAPIAVPAAVVEAQAAPKTAASPVAKPAPVAMAAAEKPIAKKAALKVSTAKTAVAKKTVRKAPAREPVAAKNTSKPTTTITQLKDKIMATTKTSTTDYTTKAKEAVAEMQTRAKAAYDKAGEMTADVTAFHKGNFDAVVEAGKVLASGMQDMGRSYVEDVKSAAETVTADVKKMVAVKSPTELFQLQGEIARRNLDTLVAKTSKNAEVMMKLANDMFAPISTRASVAMERLNKAA